MRHILFVLAALFVGCAHRVKPIIPDQQPSHIEVSNRDFAYVVHLAYVCGTIDGTVKSLRASGRLDLADKAELLNGEAGCESVHKLIALGEAK